MTAIYKGINIFACISHTISFNRDATISTEVIGFVLIASTDVKELSGDFHYFTDFTTTQLRIHVVLKRPPHK